MAVCASVNVLTDVDLSQLVWSVSDKWFEFAENEQAMAWLAAAAMSMRGKVSVKNVQPGSGAASPRRCKSPYRSVKSLRPGRHPILPLSFLQSS